MSKALAIGVLIALLIFAGCNSTNNIVAIDSNKVKELSIASLNDTPNGWLWHQKKVTKISDIEKVVDFISSLKLEKVKQIPEQGTGLMIKLKEDKEYTFIFQGDRVEVNKILYGVDIKDYENGRNLYKSLNYTENISRN